LCEIIRIEYALVKLNFYVVNHPIPLVLRFIDRI